MSEASFTGTRRQTPTRVMGANTWGRVYPAYDHERNAFVAVKLLQRASPEALLRFKREFRSLQDVVHPNLVTLYELLSDGDPWFFTMELVDGKNFLEHVHGVPRRVRASSYDGRGRLATYRCANSCSLSPPPTLHSLCFSAPASRYAPLARSCSDSG